MTRKEEDEGIYFLYLKRKDKTRKEEDESIPFREPKTALFFLSKEDDGSIFPSKADDSIFLLKADDGIFSRKLATVFSLKIRRRLFFLSKEDDGNILLQKPTTAFHFEADDGIFS